MKAKPSWRVAIALALTLGLAAGMARGQSTAYPNRPIKMVVGFAAGGGTDVVARIVLRLNVAARQALASPDAKQRLAELGMTNGSSSPEELDAYIKAEIAKWSQVIKDAGIQAQD
jgi:tripartite-type tricarboxylate transporter receptor subunit TctC